MATQQACPMFEARRISRSSKVYLPLLSLTLSLSGCGGGGDESATTAVENAKAAAISMVVTSAPAIELPKAVSAGQPSSAVEGVLASAPTGAQENAVDAMAQSSIAAVQTAPAAENTAAPNETLSPVQELVPASLPVTTPVTAPIAAVTAPATTLAATATVTTIATATAAPAATPSLVQSSQLVATIQSADIAFNLDSLTASNSRAGDLQCDGTINKISSNINGKLGNDGAGSSELKYGWVADPSGAGKPVSYFSIRNTDPDTAGSGNKRCEHSFSDSSQSIPWDQDFWFAVSARTGSLAGSTDQQSLWQWHDQSSVAGLSPYLAAYVAGNRLFIVSRSNQNSTITQSTTIVNDLYTVDNWAANSWYEFVVQARLNNKNNASSYIRIWLNGVLIVDRVGPVGYLYANQRDYAKNGLYHWTNSGNIWQNKIAKREAWFKGPALIRNRDGYTNEAIATLLN